MSLIERRDFLVKTAVAAVSVGQMRVARAAITPRSVKVAAIQFAPVLADVDANLNRSRTLIMKAAKEGARWIVLPEFFTSGLAMDRKMWDAYRPIDGEPTQFLKEIAKAHGVYVGGSFLAQSGGDVFNSFVLATPDGRIRTHDKDFPSTIFESSFYAGGEDEAYVAKLESDGFKTIPNGIGGREDNDVDGVLQLGDVNVGVALCWELIRYRTARRLRGKIDLLLGASGWWWASPEFEWPNMSRDMITQGRKTQTELIQNAPRQLARMTGAPVVHANFTGVNRTFSSHKFSTQVSGRYMGQSQIVDSNGETVMLLDDEPGIAIGNIEIGAKSPQEPIPPNEFWLPEFPKQSRESWSQSGALGRNFYLRTTRGKIAAIQD